MTSHIRNEHDHPLTKTARHDIHKEHRTIERFRQPLFVAKPYDANAPLRRVSKDGVLLSVSPKKWSIHEANPVTRKEKMQLSRQLA
jgi:hypothetical protein